MKKSFSEFLDILSEFSLYFIVAAIPFSVAFTEISVSLAISAFFVRKVLKSGFAFRPSVISIAILLFVIWNVLSISKSEYLYTSFRGAFKAVKFTLLFFAVLDGLSNQRIFKNLITTFVLVSIIVCLDGLAQYVIGCDPIRFRVVDFLDNPRRISASFHHANDYGGFLVLIAPVFLNILFSKFNDIKPKIVLAPVLFLVLVCLVLTRSKGAWLGFAVSIFILGLLKGKRFFIIFLIVFILLPILLVPQIPNRIKTIFFEPRGTRWERVKLWEGTINMIKTSPIIGLGVNTYSKNFPKYKPADYPDIKYAHNSFLQMASEIGLVGLGIFTFIVSYIMLFAFRNIKNLSLGWMKEAYVGLFCGLIGFLIHSGVDTHLYALVLATLFWFTLAVLFKGPDLLTIKNDATV